MDMGHALLRALIHGGELAGLTTIAFEWESADASIAGSDAINGDEPVGDTGVSVLRRIQVMMSRRLETTFCVYVTGPPTADGLDYWLAPGQRPRQRHHDPKCDSRCALRHGLELW